MNGFEEPRWYIYGETNAGQSWIDRETEIVRCRDCKWSRIFDGKRYPGKRFEGMTYCINWGDGIQGEWTNPDGFCHRGVLRGDA